MALPASQPSIDTCNACGKLFPRVAIRLCTGCSFIEEHRFELVRAFVQDHDGASVIEIARGTAVSGSDVRKFLDGGRLVETRLDGGQGCTCDGVGTRCRSCRTQLSSQLRTMEASMARDLTDSGSTASGSNGTPRVSYVRRMRRIDGHDA